MDTQHLREQLDSLHRQLGELPVEDQRKQALQTLVDELQAVRVQCGSSGQWA